MGKPDRYMDRDINSEMQTLTEMQMADDIRAMRMERCARPSLTGGTRRSSGHATSGLRNRGLFFWIMLAIMVYWFILKPLGF